LTDEENNYGQLNDVTEVTQQQIMEQNQALKTCLVEQIILLLRVALG
jgi:hypothetical protein